MFKDYYAILECVPESTADEVKRAYRSLSMKWHPDRNDSAVAKERMQDVNEAYSILKVSATRSRYDAEYRLFKQTTPKQAAHSQTAESANGYTYDYDVSDSRVRDDMAAARDYAKKLVDDFFNSLKENTKTAGKGCWEGAKGYLWGFAILAILGIIIRTCVEAAGGGIEGAKTPITSLSEYAAPQTWTRHKLFNAFSIAVPPTVEKRGDRDTYSLVLETGGHQSTAPNTAMFQQKGLSENTAEARSHYCRVIATYVKGKAGEYGRRNETEPLDYNAKTELRQLVDNQLGDFKLLSLPEYSWVSVNGANAIEIKYTRTGAEPNSTTNCAIYLFSDYSRMLMLMVSYREQEREMWMPDFGNIVKTFRWE